jgi:hypothetical protein
MIFIKSDDLNSMWRAVSEKLSNAEKILTSGLEIEDGPTRYHISIQTALS